MSENHTSPEEVTLLLRAVSQGSQDAFDRLFPVIYESLKQIARMQLRRGGKSKTINTTDLVHETYLKMRVQAPPHWNGRSHFYAVASRAMRQILVDYARYKNAAKRNNPDNKLTLTYRECAYDFNMTEMLSLNQALEILSKLNDRLSKVVEYRFFGGMQEDEIAQVLGVTKRTVHRDWIKARLFLHEELYPEIDRITGS
jgi:RNA polymerase sigma factor (TIGR02999 family)